MSKEWFKFSRKRVYGLFIYYAVLLLVGIIIVIPTLLFESMETLINGHLSVTAISIIGGIGAALCGSTIFYSRKLYKACINLDFEEPNDEQDKIKEMGILFYFLLRPLFAIAFSILIHISLKAGVRIMTVTEIRMSQGFVYLTMFLSFFAGFAAGDVLTYIESKGKEFAEKAFKGN